MTTWNNSDISTSYMYISGLSEAPFAFLVIPPKWLVVSGCGFSMEISVNFISVYCDIWNIDAIVFTVPELPLIACITIVPVANLD